MDPTTRRSFVRKSLATTVTLSFAGLIRAHGAQGGGETTNTTVATTVATTVSTTIATTGTVWLKRRWDCKQAQTPGQSTAFTAAQLANLYNTFSASHPDYATNPVPSEPSGSIYISGPEVLESGILEQPSINYGQRENIRCEDYVEAGLHYAVIRYYFVQYRYYSNGSGDGP